MKNTCMFAGIVVVIACGTALLASAAPLDVAAPFGAVADTTALWENAGANIYNTNSGNVGIGTRDPGYKLDVAGNGHFSTGLKVDGMFSVGSQSAYANTDGTVLSIEQANPNGIGLYVTSTLNYFSGNAAFDEKNIRLGTPYSWFTKTVGIGNTLPLAQLTVNNPPLSSGKPGSPNDAIYTYANTPGAALYAEQGNVNGWGIYVSSTALNYLGNGPTAMAGGTVRFGQYQSWINAGPGRSSLAIGGPIISDAKLVVTNNPFGGGCGIGTVLDATYTCANTTGTALAVVQANPSGSGLSVFAANNNINGYLMLGSSGVPQTYLHISTGIDKAYAEAIRLENTGLGPNGAKITFNSGGGERAAIKFGQNALTFYHVNGGDIMTLANQKLEVAGGVRLNTAGSRPSCDATTRGTLWFDQGASSNTKDSLSVCAKNTMNVYAWRVIY